MTEGPARIASWPRGARDSGVTDRRLNIRIARADAVEQATDRPPEPLVTTRSLTRKSPELMCDRAGDSSFVVDLIERGLRNAPALFETMRSTRRGVHLHRAAHNVKSIYDATRLAASYQGLAAMAELGSLTGSADLIALIEDPLIEDQDAPVATAVTTAALEPR